ncbi:hypothetical protein [Deinococcus sp. QL22]
MQELLQERGTLISHERVGTKAGNKGIEAVLAVIETANLLRTL